MSISLDQFSQMIPNNQDPSAWYQPALDMFQKYNISTINRVAGFMAQCGHESLDFTVLVENMNYNWQGLRAVFPSTFPTDQSAQQVEHQPQVIANIVYANRMGNGDAASNDGWTFRGHGLIQLSGRYNFTQFGSTVGMSAEQAVQYATTPAGAIETACWYWQNNNLNSYCDNNDINGLTRAINGGYNGLQDRTNRYNNARTLLGA